MVPIHLRRHKKQRGSNVFAGEREKLNVNSFLVVTSGEKGEDVDTSLSIAGSFTCTVSWRGVEWPNFWNECQRHCIGRFFSWVGRKLGLPHRRTNFFGRQSYVGINTLNLVQERTSQRSQNIRLDSFRSPFRG